MKSHAIWQVVHEHLEQTKQHIIMEIRNYPPPIPACDVQFNTLMRQRAAITRELGLLDAVVGQDRSEFETMTLINDFLDSSECLDAPVKAAIHQRLNIR